MERLLYQPHEARRHTAAIRELLERDCKALFPGPGIHYRLKDGPWCLRGPAEHMSISVYQRAGCCQSHPVCDIQIDRPKSKVSIHDAKAGLHDYTKATALFLDPAQQAGNTRLIGHLQRDCPFLPKFEVTLAYAAAENSQPALPARA